MRTILMCAALAAVAACDKTESTKRATDAAPACATVHSPVLAASDIEKEMPGARSWRRRDSVSESKGVRCVEVAVRQFAAFQWEISIANQRAEPIAVVWDESSFVNPGGIADRLINMNHVLLIDAVEVPGTQAPTSVPRGASVVTTIEPESLLKLEQSNWRRGDPTSYLGIDPGSFESPARLSLAVKSGGATETWEGTVTFAPPTAEADGGP